MLKECHDLIRMMEYLRDNGVSAHCNIIGDGPERRIWKNKRQLEFTKDDPFKGSLKNKMVQDLLCKSDAFISTVTGTSLREAGLVGLPIIGCNIGWEKTYLSMDHSFHKYENTPSYGAGH